MSLDDAAAVRAEQREVFSVPGAAWRTIACAGDVAAEVAVLTAGDQKKHPVWSREVEQAAREAGVCPGPLGVRGAVGVAAV